MYFIKLVSKYAKQISKLYYSTTHPAPDPPLAGIRILDLTRIVAGPYCTMILGDLGADVIKIEHPNGGDEARKWGPPFAGDESCYFLCLNRNKRSMCVDLKSPAGQKIIYDLASKSDVLVENYVPGKLSELNLGYEDLIKAAPHIIYCSITGYGSTGPYRDRPGYDVIAASIGGLLNITGPQDGGPVKVGVAVTDISTGLYAHGAILAALIKKARTGLGLKIDCNLLSTQIASLINIGSNFLIANQEGQKWGTAHPSIVPYEAFPTRDGFFTVGTGSDRQFQDFCARIGLYHLAQNSKFVSNASRVQHRDELIRILKAEFRKKGNSEWGAVFEGAAFPCGPVNTLEQTFDDPHVKAIGLVEEIEHPTAGPVKMVGPPVRFSPGGNCIRLPPPTLGQHTEEILRDVLGYEEAEILALGKHKIAV